MPAAPVRYRSTDEDSDRWTGFPFRPGDIVISTRSKHGTTWAQMICALLVFGTPDLPAPLPVLSPWLDWVGTPRAEVWAHLAAQGHRRFVKTHTPLDGLPDDRRVTFLVVARHPLDAAVSLYHQGSNLDRARQAELTGASVADTARPAVGAWLRRWIAADADPRAQLDSLPGVVAHVGGAWARRHDDRVVLVHYADLSSDLPGTMRSLAGRLGVAIDEASWPSLVGAARFGAMRERAPVLAPDAGGLLRDPRRFFRRGTSGEGERLLDPDDLAAYHRRAATLAPPDLLRWLHRPEGGHARSG